MPGATSGGPRQASLAPDSSGDDLKGTWKPPFTWLLMRFGGGPRQARLAPDSSGDDLKGTWKPPFRWLIMRFGRKKGPVRHYDTMISMRHSSIKTITMWQTRLIS